MKKNKTSKRNGRRNSEEPGTQKTPDFYEQNGTTTDTKCKLCNEAAADIRKEYRDNAITDGRYAEKLKGWVCYPCQESAESEPQGTIIIYKPQEGTAEKWDIRAIDDLRWITGQLIEDDLENIDFEPEDNGTAPLGFEYHSTDAWRGYYEPKGEGWLMLHSDCALSYSADEQELKKFDEEVKKILWRQGLEFAICFGRTSNLFSTGYDVYVRPGEADLKYLAAIMIVQHLKMRYRDPERFRLTALTGKDEFDDKDKLLGEAAERLQKGEDFETVSKDILDKAAESRRED